MAFHFEDRDSLGSEPVPHLRILSEPNAFQGTISDLRIRVGFLLGRPLEQLSAFLQVLLSRAEWKVLAVPFLFALMLSSQGCSIMYEPRFDEESGFRESPFPLSDEEVVRRSNLFRELLSDPKDQTNLALLSGISLEHQQRILGHLEELFSETHPHDFSEYLDVCRLAREKLGILHYDRYSAHLLREVVANHQDPERHRDRPPVVVFMARKDKRRFGFDALNVEAHSIERLTKKYKVFLFETDSMTEMLFHIDSLVGQQFIQRGKLKSLVLGAHGNEDENQTGVDKSTLHSLRVLDEYFEDGAMVVLANCYAAEGLDEADNLVSRLSLLWTSEKKIRVFGCDELLIDVDFDLQEDGTFLENSLRLRSPANTLSLGMITSTHEGHPERIVSARLLAVGQMDGIQPSFIRSAVEAGIFDAVSIRSLSEAKLSVQQFSDMSHQLALRGICLAPSTQIECLKRNFLPDEILAYVQSIGGLHRVSKTTSADEMTGFISQKKHRENLASINPGELSMMEARK